LFCPYTPSTTTQGLCPDTNHPHRLIASQRTEAAINTWGQHLFPLVAEAEVRLKGSRDMPNYQPNISRSNYYGVAGIIDVISSVNLVSAPPGNLILHYIHQHTEVDRIINNFSSQEYEIIIDYKGMRRPITNSHIWFHHEWQLLTYAWLRSQQPQSRPIAAGIIFYLNELALSGEDTEELRDDVAGSLTDVMPSGQDLNRIQNWRRGMTIPDLTRTFRERRSIRIIPGNDTALRNSLQRFDGVVSTIENSVLLEMRGNPIIRCWDTNPVQRTCTACDFKTFCPNPAPAGYVPTVP
jgi:CRISPR/Cas system-associated exonuclease Cas4 (RecB family)